MSTPPPPPAASAPLFRSYAALFRRQRGRSIAVVATLALGGLFEAAGVIALIPLLEGQVAGDDSRIHSVVTHLSSDETTLAWIGLSAILGFGLLSILMRALGERALLWSMALAENSVRADLSDALLQVRWPEVHNIRLGETSSSMMVATGKTGLGFSSLLQATANIIVAVPFIVGAILISPSLTLFTLVAAAAALGSYRLVSGRVENRSAELGRAAEALATEITEVFGHLKYFRSSGSIARFRERLLSVFFDYDRASYRAASSSVVSRATFEVAGIAMVSIVLATTIARDGSVSASALVLLALFYRLSPRLQAVQLHLHNARLGRSWLANLEDRTAEARAVADRRTGTAIASFASTVELRNVSFRYTSDGPDVLDDISLVLRPGECLAIVGPSGGGKTTLLDLLTGLLEPTGGSVLVDGMPLEDADIELWRSSLGVVLQESPVFHDTALTNIALDDDEPDRARAEAAATLAHAGFLTGLDGSLDAMLGERGSRLSGGQRQRIAIARALYREPRILVLDEATSALDSDSEAAIQQTLVDLKGKVSTVLVAHRLGTVKMADRILVIEHGRIVEQGSWDELAKKPKARFREMLESQRVSVSHTEDS